ncbi:MAG TPA: PilZ domain-containing protein [Candidatus Polarisedimenticolia bacterium]|nr:PilZ domain-containing protein [Candidatus Polarisedimenticolia bacterium]
MERRQAALRRRKRVEVIYGVEGGQHFTGYSGNISATGIMIRAVRVFGQGTLLAMEMKFPERTVHAKGLVTWAREGSLSFLSTGRVGMGVRFVDPVPDLSGLIARS